MKCVRGMGKCLREDSGPLGVLGIPTALDIRRVLHSGSAVPQTVDWNICVSYTAGVTRGKCFLLASGRKLSESSIANDINVVVGVRH